MILFDLIGLVFVLLFVWGIIALANWGRSRLDGNRSALVESRNETHAAVAALNKAESTLRRIANGAGNPVLEASIALDEITNYHETRELN